MAIHRLKLNSDYFEDVKNGLKTFEIRKNDRDYKVGDTLVLHLWVETDKIAGYASVVGQDNHGTKIVKKVPEYLADNIIAKVTYITDYKQKDGYVVLGIEV